MRFFDVKDARMLATKLDNIFICNLKIFVNLPRFERRKSIEFHRNQVTKGESNGGNTQS